VFSSIPVLHPEEARIFKRRLQFLNRELTFFTAGLALGAACSDAPVIFGYLSAILVLVVGCHFNGPYNRIFKLWREVKHPLVQVRRVWPSYVPIMLAWLILGAVAAGILNKNGFVLPY
jgi:hypothetical protein